jgi:nanoRNase/pAp phosphatase (c-di-AMP/oligoRNAs hydrolase)
MKNIESQFSKFKEELIAFYKEAPQLSTVAILTHENPDPDAIGAGFGMQKLIKSWLPDVKCIFLISGEISHPQNKTMVNVLNLQMVQRTKPDDLVKMADAFIVVDSIPERCGMDEVLPCLFTVDHHKGDTKKSKYRDIRLVGACSTLVWDLLQKEKVVFDKTNDEDCNIATALVVGIKTDTSDLSSDNVTDLDFTAYKSLIGCINQNKLSKILKYPLPPYHFELRSRLDQEGNSSTDNGVFIGGIGYIPPSKRDALPTIADERARVEGVDTSFIFAIVGDSLEFSIRSNSLSIDVHALVQNIFGKENGGGKMGSGAAKIKLPFSLEEASEKIINGVWIAVRDFYIERISQYIETVK